MVAPAITAMTLTLAAVRLTLLDQKSLDDSGVDVGLCRAQRPGAARVGTPHAALAPLLQSTSCPHRHNGDIAWQILSRSAAIQCRSPTHGRTISARASS